MRIKNTKYGFGNHIWCFLKVGYWIWEGKLRFWPLNTEFLQAASKRIDMHPYLRHKYSLMSY